MKEVGIKSRFGLNPVGISLNNKKTTSKYSSVLSE